MIFGGVLVAYLMVYNQMSLADTNQTLRLENVNLKTELSYKPKVVEVEVPVVVHDTVYVELFGETTDLFSYIYPRFKVFNNEVDTTTVDKFIEVMHRYQLDTTDQMIELYVGQILLESGAKQYYPSNHPKSGKLVISSGGAIGFCQIIPSTCYGYLKKYATEADIEVMCELGATDFSFVYDETKSKSKRVSLCRQWLTDQTNNMIMWGFITSNNIVRKNGNVVKQLVSYNAGTGGMQDYVNNGGSLHNHHYIKGIHNKLNYAEEALED